MNGELILDTLLDIHFGRSRFFEGEQAPLKGLKGLKGLVMVKVLDEAVLDEAARNRELKAKLASLCGKPIGPAKAAPAGMEGKLRAIELSKYELELKQRIDRNELVIKQLQLDVLSDQEEIKQVRARARASLRMRARRRPPPPTLTPAPPTSRSAGEEGNRGVQQLGESGVGDDRLRHHFVPRPVPHRGEQAHAHGRLLHIMSRLSAVCCFALSMRTVVPASLSPLLSPLYSLYPSCVSVSQSLFVIRPVLRLLADCRCV